ncbi:hypothetical protein J6590_098024 [Homalodisca vitripennis]|nr:hypothetical protein J6590_098024 [Homalodisca vitripennis]
MLQLFEHEGCRYLLTSRLNQDPIENLFSSIRQRGGFNRNPTVRVFRGSLRIAILNQLMETPRSTSYDPDMDDLLDLHTTLEGGNDQGNEVASVTVGGDEIDSQSSSFFYPMEGGQLLDREEHHKKRM